MLISVSADVATTEDATSGKSAGDHPLTSAQLSVWVTGFILLSVLLYALSLYSYLLFHTVAELASIVIAVIIFVVTWYTRRFINNNCLVFIGIAYLFIGGIDLVHMLAFKGMNIFAGFDTNLPTQLWIAARTLQALTLLVAPFMLHRKMNERLVFAGYLAIFVLLMLSIFTWHIFPTCYIEGQGLTPFKIGMEYVISGILVAAMYLLYRNRDVFDHSVITLLYLSLAATILSELAFTTYVSVFAFTNFLGHIFKILAFLCIYLAIIDTGFSRPYALIFRALSQSREELRDLNARLEGKVEERTKELGRLNEELQASYEQLAAADEELRQQYSALAEKDAAIQALNQDLEKRVKERTSELRKTNEDLLNAQKELREQFAELGDRDKQLTDSDVRYRALFEEALDGICLADVETGFIIDCNQALAALVGRERAELIGQPQTILHPTNNEHPALSPTFRQHLTEKQGQILETQVVTKTGIIREVEIKANLLNIQGQEILQGIFRDITERKKAEEALHTSEIRYRRLFETAQDGILILDAETGQIVDANPFLIDMLGFSHKQFLGKKIWDIGVFKDIVANKDNFEELQRKEYIRYEDLPLETADGRNIAVEFVSNVYTVNNKKVIQCNIRDITDRKKIEEALNATETRYRRLFEAAQEGILILDAETGQIVEVNPFLIAFLGFSREEFLGKKIWDIGVFKDIVANKDNFEELQRKEYIRYEDLPLETADGRNIAVEFVSNVYMVNNKKVIQCNIRDITDRKRAEAVIHESEQRFHAVVDSARDGILVTDQETHRFVMTNAAILKQTGYSETELLSLSIPDLILPAVLPHAMEQFEKQGRGEIGLSSEIPILRKDGTVLFVDINSAPIIINDRQCLISIARDITERKAAEKVLQESEERYRTILQTTMDGFWIIDLPEGKIMEVNETYCQMSGYTRAELLKMRIPDLDAIKTLDEQAATLQSVITNGSGIFETRHHRKDGSVFDVELSVTYQNTNSPKLMCFCRDITERKLAEVALNATETRYRRLFETAQDGILILDAGTGQIVEVNPFLIAFLGFSREQFMGKKIWEIGLFKDIVANKDNFEELQRKESIRYENLPLETADGRNIAVEFVSNVYMVDNKKVIQCNIRDITERKRTGEKLLQLSERLSLATRAGGVGIWDWDVVNNTLIWDDQMFALYGITREQFGGAYEAWREGLHPEDKQRGDEEIQMALRGEKEFDTEFRVLWPNGIIRILHALALVQRDTSGKPLRMIGTNWDITEQKKMTDQIKISLAEKETLLKEIHHRVKNNLQIITSMLNLQIRKVDNPTIIEALKDSQSRVRSMALVHEHLYSGKDISHIDLGNYIRALGTGLFQSYEAAKQGIRFDLNIRDIYVDINTSVPLGLMCNELITNSLKYAFREKKDGKISITATEDPRALTFIIADNGTGIPEGITLENQASLGLRLVSILTEQLKGTVAIDRTEGTKFVFTIPKPAEQKLTEDARE
jgi:PAS domain S-box-containing protein